MINHAEIRQQAEKWWPAVLRSALLGESYFPKALHRIGKVKAKDRLRAYERIREQQDALIAQSKKQTGQGYRLHWVERKFRDVGRNRFIDGISFDTLEDYLGYLKRGAIYKRFQQDADLICTRFPALTAWCLAHPLLIEQQHGNWENLLALLRYFLEEHQLDRYYIREIPVAVPTKFVETHKKILSSLLEAMLPTERIRTDYHPTRQFEQRYGLRYREPLLRIRLLDRAIAEKYFSGLEDISLPIRDFQQLKLPLQRLIILENKTNFNNLMNFLTLPATQATAAIFGSGFGVGSLKDVAWLHQMEIYYWGDIDAHGLQILSQLRGYFPHVQPFLMDRITFESYADYHTPAPPSTATLLPHLTAAEQQLFDVLNKQQLRLEQERIPQQLVQQVIAKLLT